MIISRLIEVYMWILSSVVVHELFHVFCAILLKVGIVSVKIGESFFAIKKSNVSVSPIMSGGYVEVDEEELFSKNFKCVLVFFLSGCVANVLMIILVMCFAGQYDLKMTVFFINVFIIISSICPLIKGNDINGILCYMKKKSG